MCSWGPTLIEKESSRKAGIEGGRTQTKQQLRICQFFHHYAGFRTTTLGMLKDARSQILQTARWALPPSTEWQSVFGVMGIWSPPSSKRGSVAAKSTPPVPVTNASIIPRYPSVREKLSIASSSSLCRHIAASCGSQRRNAGCCVIWESKHSQGPS